MHKNINKSLRILIIVILVVLMMFPSAVLASTIRESDALDKIGDSAIVRRRYTERLVTYPFWYDYSYYYYLDVGEFAGYLSYINHTDSNTIITVLYGGYIYNKMYPIPGPAEAIDYKELLENVISNINSNSKNVNKVVNYDRWLTGYTDSIWYNDGTYFGWIYATEAWQNSDYSWRVIYSGKVYTAPYVPVSLPAEDQK